MGAFGPVYPPKDLAKLDEKQRNQLRMAIVKVLQTDPEVRKLLKKKTDPVFERLIGTKKKKAK
jgi:hypothetical protein